MSNDEIRDLVKRVKANLRVTKVVATRSVKGKYGDTYVGFSAAWNTVQEDGGHDLLSTGDETDASTTVTSMTLQEALVASCLLAREADIAAHRNAMAGGNISPASCDAAIRAIKQNYSQVLVSVLDSGTGSQPPAKE
jgi:hypothetical protein